MRSGPPGSIDNRQETANLNAQSALGILSSQEIGSSAPLIADRDAWYRNLAPIVGLDSPGSAPRTVDEAFARIVRRSRIDDSISPIDWDDLDETDVVESNDHELADGLWLTNIGGGGADRSAYRARIARNWPTEEFGPLRLGPLSTQDAIAVRAAVDLLQRHFAPVWDECLKTVSLIAMYRSPVKSMQNSFTPETAYVSYTLLQEGSWVVADAILHEVLHERTLLARQLWQFMAPNYSEHDGPTIHLPWSGGPVPDRHFTAWRLLSAAHVYTHLATFRMLMGREEEANMPVFRGNFMLNALSEPDFATRLGPDGIRWRDSLRTAMAEIS